MNRIDIIKLSSFILKSVAYIDYPSPDYITEIGEYLYRGIYEDLYHVHSLLESKTLEPSIRSSTPTGGREFISFSTSFEIANRFGPIVLQFNAQSLLSKNMGLVPVKYYTDFRDPNFTGTKHDFWDNYPYANYSTYSHEKEVRSFSPVFFDYNDLIVWIPKYVVEYNYKEIKELSTIFNRNIFKSYVQQFDNSGAPTGLNFEKYLI